MKTNREFGERTVDSPVGRLVLRAQGGRLTHLVFAEGAPPAAERSGSPTDAAVLDRTGRQLGEYFEGRRRAFDLPLAPEGTPFQLEVWNWLRSISWGETASYGEVARGIGRPAAVRAVGAANGRNPISIIVPCHRVIGADGSLTGYGGGLAAKRTLLELERGGG